MKKSQSRSPFSKIMVLAIILIGVVATSFYAKKSLSGKKAEGQQVGKTDIASETQRQTASYTEIETDNQTGQPGFSISPPEGWLKATDEESSAIIAFVASKKDQVDIGDELIYELPASVQVHISPVDPYYCQNLSELVDAHNEVRYKNEGILKNEIINLQDHEGRLIEVVKTLPDLQANLHIHERIFCINNHKIVISGLSLEDFWNDNLGAILTSLDSFMFLSI